MLNIFSGCSGLTSVTIPNSVTSIEGGAFYGCSGLTSVTIGSGIKTIGEQAFANCSNIADVYCYAEQVPDTNIDAFEGSLIDYATLYVPDASVNDYKTTAPWSGFKEVKGLNGSMPDVKKCATPTIAYMQGEIVFSCETEGVEFVSEVKVPEAKKYYDSRIMLAPTYEISVYATLAGYENSDVATAVISWRNGHPVVMRGFSNVRLEEGGGPGDLNGDGTIDIGDIMAIIKMMAVQ